MVVRDKAWIQRIEADFRWGRVLIVGIDEELGVWIERATSAYRTKRKTATSLPSLDEIERSHEKARPASASATLWTNRLMSSEEGCQTECFLAWD